MSLQYQGVGIHIKVKEIEASRKFYEKTLDLVPVFGYGSEEFRKTLPESVPSVIGDGLPGVPESYAGVVYEPTPQSPLEIAEWHIAVPDHAVFTEPITSPKISAMVRVDSLVPLIVEKGVRASYPVCKYYWSTIEAVVKDPDGFVLVIIAPYSEEAMKALEAVVKVKIIEPS